MKFAALLIAAAASLSAQQCSYSLSANSFVMGAAASGTSPEPSFTVTTDPQTCTFTAATTASWIHLQNGPNYTGTSQVLFLLDSNATSTMLRSDVITITTSGGSGTVSVAQLAGICDYILSSTSADIPVAGGSGSFNVTSGCPWSVVSSQGWANLGSNTSFLGNGTVNYTVAANGCVASQSATITVENGLYNPPTFQITQDGSAANLSISPASATVGVGASVGRVTVNTGDNCSWSAFSDASWLQITTSLNAYGAGGASYSIQANTGPQRTGNVHVSSGGVSVLFPVTQQGAAAPTPNLTTILNAASYNSPTYANGPVSPGEIVALGGTNLGPATGVSYLLSSDGKSISNLLAGVQVLFNGTAAPLLYVSATQINAIVPYEVAGSANANIQVTYQGLAGGTLAAPVQTATPGLFSLDKSGSGPGAILNQDYSVNSGTNPAARGTAILIYCTGAGVTNPPGSDGVLTPLTQPFLLIPAPVTVLIGGVQATVAYAGAAPGSVAGLTQINAIVPAAAASGSVPVVVQIGTYSSQTGVTVAVQ
jgi:uncharacterized protein (TIGR03437 family)